MAAQTTAGHEHRGEKLLARTVGLRMRLLVLLFGLTTISVLSIGYTGIHSLQRAGEQAQQTSALALREQAEDYLRQITVSDAQRFDLIMKKVADDAQKVAQYAANVFTQPDVFMQGGYWPPEAHIASGPDGQYLNDESDVSSAFVPNTGQMDEATLRDLELTAYMDFVFSPVSESNPNTAAIYIGTERSVIRYYPNIHLGALVPPDFDVTRRPWYIAAAPQANPTRRVVWSPVYLDATGKGLMVTAAAPIYTAGDEFIGVVGIDFTLQDISASIEQARLHGGYSFLVDSTGHAIVLPAQGYRDLLGRAPAGDEFWTDLSAARVEFVPILARMRAGETGFVSIWGENVETGNSRELFIAYAPFASTGWSLGNVVEAETVLAAVGDLRRDLQASTRSLWLERILPVSAAVLVVIALTGLLVANYLTGPIRQIAAAAQRIGAGEWDAPLPQAAAGEIGALAQAFSAMARQLRGLMEGMEERVAARTRSLEQRTIQLETAAQVARDAALIHDIDRLLDTTVRLIAERFGFYHVGIYLVDENKKYAVLRAASSEGGQRMLARSHKLAILSEDEWSHDPSAGGLVSYVARFGLPRLARADGQEDGGGFSPDPDLPLARAEAALPLRIRGRIIGVLDVQSVDPATFAAEGAGDAEGTPAAHPPAVLQIMADQVALAIENARLLEEAEKRLREVDILLGRYRREGWEMATAGHPTWGYTYDEGEITPLQPLSDPATRPEAHLSIPLQIRGATIGQVNVDMGEHPVTADVKALIQAVAEQASLALENARLFEETQRTLMETDALYRASHAIGAAISPREVEQALIDFTASSGVDAARILLFEYNEAAAADARPDSIVMSEGWTVDDRPAQPYGARIAVRDYPLAQFIDVREPFIVEDVLTDARVDERTRVLVAETSGLRSFAMIPIAVGERVLGLLFVGRDQPSTFPEDIVRGYWTLAGQAAVALESMRLLDETRQRVEQERLIGEITARMRETMDVDAVLQTAVREIGAALRLRDVTIQLSVNGDGERK